MDFNIDLLKKTETDLAELSNIIKLRVHDRSIVLAKVYNVIDELEKVNQVKKESLERYKTNWNLFIEKSQNNQLAFSEMMKDVDKSLEFDWDDLTKDPPTFDETKYDNWTTDMALDMDLVNSILNDYNDIRCTENRRQWVKFDKRMFTFYKLIIISSQLIVSTLLGYVASEISTYFFPKIHQLLAALILTFISYVTIDKSVNKIADSLFWKIISKQVLKLYIHFKLHLDHINSIINGLKKNMKK